jgi:antitoxin (DNA-binding transcriptional repressor) of toxin-antitoxin stability system
LPNQIFRLSEKAMKTISVTEAARNFSDLVSSVHYRGETALLVKGGRPMVKISPARRAKTGRDLAALWPGLPRLTPAEATAFEHDLKAARRVLRPVKSKWD